jgi:hypothetical protein
MFVTISRNQQKSWHRPKKDFAIPVFLNSRGAPRPKKRIEAERFRRVAPVVDKAAAADLEAPESGIATPPEPPHRPPLVPGVGAL